MAKKRSKACNNARKQYQKIVKKIKKELKKKSS